MTIIFASFIGFGHLLICYGSAISSIYMMIIGRFCFGIGGESLNITISTMFIRWF